MGQLSDELVCLGPPVPADGVPAPRDGAVPRSPAVAGTILKRQIEDYFGCLGDRANSVFFFVTGLDLHVLKIGSGQFCTKSFTGLILLF